MSDLGNRKTFAENLTMYIEISGKTKKEIADDLGFPYSTFNEWTTGKKYPRMKNIEILANYFRIQKSDLIERKTEADIKEIEQNDTSVLLTVRLRTDEEFLSVVEGLDKLDAVQLASVKQIVEALLRK